MALKQRQTSTRGAEEEQKAMTEEGGKLIGAAIIGLVKVKFSFNEHSEFPT